MMTQCFKLAMFVLCLFHSVLNGQSSYRFEASTGTYSELGSAQKISFAQMDSLSGFYRLKELDGESFKWYNTLFKIDDLKTFHIQPNANVRFDNDSSLIIIDGAFTYLDSIDPNSSMSYRGQPWKQAGKGTMEKSQDKEWKSRQLCQPANMGLPEVRYI
jgi:hypothetical protein